MSLFMNILWLLLGGIFTAIEYVVASLGMMSTIIGIPFGIQMFKLGLMSLFPFGQHTVEQPSGAGCIFSIFNILWMFTGGLVIAFTHLIFGILLCITVVGIPFGLQHFKLMSLALWPFGKTLV